MHVDIWGGGGGGLKHVIFMLSDRLHVALRPRRPYGIRTMRADYHSASLFLSAV